MNIESLKYALEVSKAKSINKASQTLFISQPDLSRSIKSLENELGFKIFTRTTKGIELTVDGEAFLNHAKNIIDEADEITRIRNLNVDEQTLSFCVPKAPYISRAFRNFIGELDVTKKTSIDFKESSSIGAIQEVLFHKFNIGIIRYIGQMENYFDIYFKDYGIVQRTISSFSYVVVFSKNSPLAKKERLAAEDFENYMEISHGDSYLPNVNNKVITGPTLAKDKNIRVYDSMGQLMMLEKTPTAFMFSYPLDKQTLEKYNLVQTEIENFSMPCIDVMIYHQGYRFNFYERKFISMLQEEAKKVLYQN